MIFLLLIVSLFNNDGIFFCVENEESLEMSYRNNFVIGIILSGVTFVCSSFVPPLPLGYICKGKALCLRTCGASLAIRVD